MSASFAFYRVLPCKNADNFLTYLIRIGKKLSYEELMLSVHFFAAGCL